MKHPRLKMSERSENILKAREEAARRVRERNHCAWSRDVDVADLLGEIDPSLAEAAEAIMWAASDRSERETPWMSGVRLTPEEKNEIINLCHKMCNDLVSGRRHEHNTEVQDQVERAVSSITSSEMTDIEAESDERHAASHIGDRRMTVSLESTRAVEDLMDDLRRGHSDRGEKALQKIPYLASHCDYAPSPDGICNLVHIITHLISQITEPIPGLVTIEAEEDDRELEYSK